MIYEINCFIKKYGHFYDTESTAYFFYSLVKFKHTKKFLELGTGYGVTAFAVAQAMKENNEGSVTSYDNGMHHLSQDKSPTEYKYFIEKKIKEFNLKDHFKFKLEDIGFNNIECTNIDILFSDFYRSPAYIQDLMNFFLLNCNSYSSLFIDSLNCDWSSYAYLNNMIELFNHKKIPHIFKKTLSKESYNKIKEFVEVTKFTKIDMRKKHTDKMQNGITWIKCEPYNVSPEPLII
jgi:ubiquinone/menaquinone biosynthesis C-methylase UbiE